MKSRTTLKFRQVFAKLPKQIQAQARSAYRQFKKNPTHPSLRFKKIHQRLPIYSARISKNCGATPRRRQTQGNAHQEIEQLVNWMEILSFSFGSVLIEIMKNYYLVCKLLII